jgi:hypothetical protein
MTRARLLSIAAALAASPAFAIVGASRDGEAYADRVAMVLARQGGRQSICSGVALSPRVVLTAAHCLAGAGDTLVALRIGGRTTPVAVARVARHPGFDPNAPRDRKLSIDLGLIETAAALPEGFAAARLADSAPALGEAVTVVGFGVTQEHGGPSDGRARTAELVVAAPISHVTLWAADPSRAGLGGCHGDSGGPMFAADGRVAAIVAWTNGENGRGCGAITQGPLVAPARAWIDQVRAGWGE